MSVTRLHVSALLGVITVVWGLVLVIQGVDVGLALLAPFSTVVGALMGLGLLLEFVLWRQSWLHGWFFKRPDMRGTWEVELHSTWVDPETDQRTPPITCYMGMSQTLSTLKMHLMTQESESWSKGESIELSPGGNGYEVSAVYTNRPGVQLREQRRSEMHRGALAIHTHGPCVRPETMTAEYWSDRGTAGEMTFVRRVDSVFTRFEDAECAFAGVDQLAQAGEPEAAGPRDRDPSGRLRTPQRV
jgi:hypothetical protein